MSKYFFVNYKLEPNTFGDKGIDMTSSLTEAAEAMARFDVLVIIVPQLVYLAQQVKEFQEDNIFAPHVDPHKPGRGTGFVNVESLRDMGCKGTVLNHAEHKLPFDVLKQSFERAKEVGLQVMVCADSLDEARSILKLSPDFVAYEPPDLIGGDISVSSAQPTVVKDFVDLVSGHSSPTLPIIGAGIKTRADVEMSFQLGAWGIFVASGVIKAADPVDAFTDLLDGFPS